MKAVLLVGGAGTRLRPVTYEIPKPLLTVKKKPIINHLIELFDRYGVSEIGLLASSAHEKDFKRWLETWKEELPFEKISIFYESVPRGTFGGLQQLQEWLGKESFFLSNGDELKDFNLNSLLDFHKTQNAVGTIALVEVPNPHEYGVPILEGNKVKTFLEKPKKPPSSYVNSGLYILEPDIFNFADFSKDILMIESDIFPQLADADKLVGLKMENARWYDCGNLERWEKAIKEW